MTIEIHKPELQQLVEEEISSGHFQTIDDLFMEAIRALREKSQTRTAAVDERNETPRGTGPTDWRAMRGMARAVDSLTQALISERAAEKQHDEARIQNH